MQNVDRSADLICRFISAEITVTDRRNQRGIKWQDEQARKRGERLLEGRTEIGAPTQSGFDSSWHLWEAAATPPSLPQHLNSRVAGLTPQHLLNDIVQGNICIFFLLPFHIKGEANGVFLCWGTQTCTILAQFSAGRTEVRLTQAKVPHIPKRGSDEICNCGVCQC